MVRRTKPYLSWDALKMINYAFFHSVVTYGLIFWGNFTHWDYIFKLQKRIIRIIMGARTGDSCRELFKILKILQLSYQYVFSLVMFVVNNKGLFMENSELYKIRPRNHNNLYQPSSNLTICQKGPYHIDIKVHYKLPVQIKMS
jgi:hypothetical protein